MARGKAVAIVLSDRERVELERRVRRRKSSHGAARRARIVLLAADGLSNTAIAEKLGVSRRTVGLWRCRFAEKRVCGLDDEPRPGAPRRIGDDKIAEVVTRALETTPDDATHWSRRSMARATGISATTVHRIWGAFGLQPHRVASSCRAILSSSKVRDIRRPLSEPRAGALHPKRARSRRWTAPSRCCRCGGQAEPATSATARPPRRDTATGAVIGSCATGREFRAFLDEVESAVPADLDIHVVMDNASSHKTKLIQDWFAKRPHWHSHFTPTSASWINQVERFFALLTERQIKRGAHRSTAELEAAIQRYIETHNREPKPFRWTKSADDILTSIERFCQRTLSVQHEVG